MGGDWEGRLYLYQLTACFICHENVVCVYTQARKFSHLCSSNNFSIKRGGKTFKLKCMCVCFCVKIVVKFFFYFLIDFFE